MPGLFTQFVRLASVPSGGRLSNVCLVVTIIGIILVVGVVGVIIMPLAGWVA